MNICKKNILLFCLIFFNATLSFAQKTIYQWTTHAPGSKVINVEKVHDKIYAATPYELFYYNTSDNSINKLTKVNSLSDFGISVMRYNHNTDMILIGYSNSNIDIIDNNGNITNISDIKHKNILVDKSILFDFTSGNIEMIPSGCVPSGLVPSAFSSLSALPIKYPAIHAAAIPANGCLPYAININAPSGINIT